MTMANNIYLITFLSFIKKCYWETETNNVDQKKIPSNLVAWLPSC